MQTLLGCVLPTVLAVAAGLKLFEWDATVSFVSAVVMVKRVYSEFLAGGLIVVEMMPLVALVLKLPRLANYAAMGFVLLASGVWFAVWIHTEKPDCVCFGLWSRYTLITDGVLGVFARNVLLVLPALAFLVLDQRRPHGKASRMESAPGVHAY